MPHVWIAAGGGGDAIAATILGRTLGDSSPVVASYSWDRLIVDPIPGPRTADDFTDLAVRSGYHFVTSDSQPITPAGSTLPRLAAELGSTLALIDASRGAVGIRAQIASIVEEHKATSVTIVDVGGDVIGRPGDPNLSSPLGDALIIAACFGLPTTCDVAIIGPGLDGEVPEQEVIRRLGTEPLRLLTTHDVDPFLPVLSWHPSEATALCVAAARGIRGQVEIRGKGLPVPLSDASRAVYRTSIQHIANINPVVEVLADSESFDQAEDSARRLLGFTELDYECARARQLARKTELSPIDTDRILADWERQARQRGTSHTTFRRLAEVVGVRDVAALRASLISRQPERLAAPLWHIG
ncbi:MAG: DUF1152 domain-containing protein [Dactylosporangium sp.]|nr:DUF1152 domain-containing protein [Dactylosporangium sp.]NNJ63545.1 DUF1152 domain-containing protein [Dactylosporangium sp.]